MFSNCSHHNEKPRAFRVQQGSNSSHSVLGVGVLKLPHNFSIHAEGFYKVSTPQPSMGSGTTGRYWEETAEAMKSEMFICNLDDFLAKYGPAPVSPEDIAACKKSLRDRKSVV